MRKKVKVVYQIFLSLLLSLTLVILCIEFTLNFKPLYYFDVVYLDIQNISNLSNKEIKTNYDFVINYLNTKNMDFHLPSLTFSEEGKIHFVEVKLIFNKLMRILFLCSILILINLHKIIKSPDKIFLKWSSLTLISIPVVLFLSSLINFDKFFTLFHKIMFNNNYWLLDASTDPIIKMLPEKFFLHCTILIMIILFFNSLILMVLYKKKSV